MKLVAKAQMESNTVFLNNRSDNRMKIGVNFWNKNWTMYLNKSKNALDLKSCEHPSVKLKAA